ncbi:MAG: pyridoxine 5'-phosphate synthase [candidate division Zixibacteria bacterium]|nr:pyridoxine 5'-phosphate synthase [candidate division Zixibacteria bacterium]
MIKLSVNIDHVATLREARKSFEPDPIASAIMAELAGADGITIHLRRDRRHIKDRDLKILREVVKTSLNLEMAPVQEMLEKALEIKPDMATLVPEREGEITTEGGLNVQDNYDNLTQIIPRLQINGILVSVFVNPEIESIKASAKLKTDFVEINTAKYSEVKNLGEKIEELEKVERMVELAYRLNLGINAGHGLSYKNIVDIVKIKHIDEFSIGHSIVARAVLVGFERAVREMLELVKGNV